MRRRANSVEKMQVFWPWSSLSTSACTVPRTVDSASARTDAASASVGRRPWSASKRSICWSITVFRNMASTVGAGPLMVIDTEVHRVAEIEPRVEDLHVLERADRHAGVADLAVDVGPLGRVEAVERDRVEGGRQASRRHVGRQQVEPSVGAEGVALAGEHARRVLALPLEREHAGGEREPPRKVLRAQERDQVTVIGEGRDGHPGHEGARQRGTGHCRGAVTLHDRGPGVELGLHLGRHRPAGDRPRSRGGRRHRRRSRPGGRRTTRDAGRRGPGRPTVGSRRGGSARCRRSRRGTDHGRRAPRRSCPTRPARRPPRSDPHRPGAPARPVGSAGAGRAR